MADYIYKGFKIHYDIQQPERGQELYHGYGYVTCAIDKTSMTSPKKFHTEYPTKTGVTNELKKLIEDYIDFEWKEFLDMQKEPQIQRY